LWLCVVPGEVVTCTTNLNTVSCTVFPHYSTGVGWVAPPVMTLTSGVKRCEAKANNTRDF